jgi:hypothetical protein
VWRARLTLDFCYGEGHELTVRSSIAAMALRLTQHEEASVRAIGWNLLSEERISDDRLEHFATVTRALRSDEELQRALVDYHRDWVCQRPSETYSSTARNRLNFVDLDKVPEALELVTVINVSSWVERLQARRRTGLQLERLLGHLNAGSHEAEVIVELLGGVFDGIKASSSARPVWVANAQQFWDSIDRAVPATWSTSLGVWRLNGAWQAVLSYPASAVPRLIRPSQLDSGYNQFHFPSPPCCEQPRGGLTMELDHRPVQGPLVSEWIHEPIDFRLEQWRAGGELLAAVHAGDWRPVTAYRDRHKSRLYNEFRGAVETWLPAE